MKSGSVAMRKAVAHQAARLEEARDGVVLIDRDRLENFLCGLQLTAKDQRLEFDHGQQQSKGHDGKFLSIKKTRFCAAR